MPQDRQQKVYPGNIYNRINVITMRTGGCTVTYNDRRFGQVGTSGTLEYAGDGTGYDLAASGFYDPNGVIHRFSPEPPVERNLQPNKDNDI